MKEQLKWWVKTLARLRRMAEKKKDEQAAAYNLWAETDLYRQWDKARLDMTRAKSLAQRAEGKVRSLRIRMFDGLNKGKVFGVAIRVSKPKPKLVVADANRHLLKEWMWQNARVYLKIDEQALLKMIEDGEVPAELAWALTPSPKVTATIARDLSKELEAKS